MTDQSANSSDVPVSGGVVVSSRASRLARLTGRAALVLFFAFLIGVLFVREVLLPRADAYRQNIADVLADTTGVPVSIDRVIAEWEGVRPRFQISGLVLGDPDGNPLRLERVDGTLGWSSVLRGEPYFDALVLHSPSLSVLRDKDGRVFAAGLAIADYRGRGGFSAWLLRQGQVAILDASLTWLDRLRDAPALHLDDFDLRVERIGGRFRFGLRGKPAGQIAATIDLRGDLVSANPSDPAGWMGQAYVEILSARLEGLAPWIDYPIPLSGSGDLRAWLDVDGGRAQSAVVDVDLDRLGVRLNESLPTLEAGLARGRLQGRMESGDLELSLRGFELEMQDGLRIAPMDIDFSVSGEIGALEAGYLRANLLDLEVFAKLSAYLPLRDGVRDRIVSLEPRGKVEGLYFAWDGGATLPRVTRLEGRFVDVALQAGDGLPGVAGLSGAVIGTRERGRFVVNSTDAEIDLPAVFEQARLGFNRLEAQGGWSSDDGSVEIQLDRVQFENADAAGEARGSYRPGQGVRGGIDLTARLTRARADAVWRYIPLQVSKKTRNWVRNGILDADVQDAQLILKGPLDEFPFTKGGGKFLVTVALREGRLEYARGWPLIEGIAASLRFEGPGMHIVANEGRIFDAVLRDVTADVADLGAHGAEIMKLRGVAEGRSSDFLRFVSESPVRSRVGGFADDVRSEGEGRLELGLVMPLQDVDATDVTGSFRFSGNRIHLTDWLPPLDAASGRIRFTQDSFGIDELLARAIGEPLQLTAETTTPGVVRFDVASRASLRTLHQHYPLPLPLIEHLSGTTPWHAVVDVRRGAAEVDLRSTLAGISSSLPQPFNKRASEAWPLQLNLRFAGEARELSGNLSDRLEFMLAGRQGSSGFELLRGGVGIRAPVRLPAHGLAFSARLDELDVDAWRTVRGPDTESRSEMMNLVTDIDLGVRRLRVAGYDVNELEFSATADQAGWAGRLSSDVARGSFGWQGAREGALQLKLDHLRVGSREVDETVVSRLFEIDPGYTLPDLDIAAERFELHGMDLGRLELLTRNENGIWQIDTLAISNAESKLEGSGQWRPGLAPYTALSLRFQSDNVGRFLGRIGYPEVVRGGSAELSGDLSWRGIPTRMNYPSLGGNFRLVAQNGRFSQLEPGVGRLLGVLSLQALPRRLKLDFSDVFSEGFAFDRMSGTVDVNSGMLQSEDFEISGPAARIWIAGSANLLAETQDIKVVVQPTLSESIAIGAAAGLINPVAGVIAYLAQKVLSDPIERMFAYSYRIGGKWDDPQVEKLPVGLGRATVEGG